MKKTILAVAAVLGFSAAVFAQRPDAPPTPVIVVTGEAESRVTPDEATVRLGVVRQAPTAQAAQDQANSAGKEILSAISKLGVSANDIQTSRLTLNPVYASRPETNQAPRISAYSASNIISVRLQDLSKTGAVVDAGLKAGANEVQGIQFSLKDDLPAKQQALKMAVGEARRKAETIAEALNVRLGPPLEVSENGVSLAPKEFGGGMMMARAEMAPTPVSPGQLEVHANVSIRYQILGPR